MADELDAGFFYAPYVPLQTVGTPNSNGRVYTMNMDIASMYPTSFSVSTRHAVNPDGSTTLVEMSSVNPCYEIKLDYSNFCILDEPKDHFKDEEELFKI